MLEGYNDWEYVQKLRSLDFNVKRYTENSHDWNQKNMIFEWAIKLLNEWNNFYKCKVKEYNDYAQSLMLSYLEYRIPPKRNIGF